MAKAKAQTQASKTIVHQKPTKAPHKPDKTKSWSAMRSLFTFKNHHTPKPQPQVQPQPQPQIQTQKLQKQKQKQKQKLQEQTSDETVKKCKKMRCSGSLCSNTKVMHRPENNHLSPEILKKPNNNNNNNNNNASSSSNSSSTRSMKAPLREVNMNSTNEPSGSSTGGSSFRGMPFRRFYGCAECKMVVDPVLGIIRDPSLRTTICSCPDCGEIFMNSENLELHQAVRHAVSELGPEDTSKNIVEIIFQSSWLKKQTPICKIDRILKVHNTQSTISRFEEYRDAIKAKATKLPGKKNPRCVADGNELLRFHCTTVSCQLGLRGSTNLCNSVPPCAVCSVIKNGFRVVGGGEGKTGILTTATSGRAHDSMKAQERGKAKVQDSGKGENLTTVTSGTAHDTLKVQDSGGSASEGQKAMLVCRVIAGRVKKGGGGGGGGGEGYKGNFKSEGLGEEFDSVAGEVGVYSYSNLDELYVFNPKAILPCFVVIYSL